MVESAEESPSRFTLRGVKDSLPYYAELDKRINEGWPAYEAALKKAGVDYTAHMYEGVNHSFHKDTTPRYDEKAAELAWKRTLDFFNAKLR